METLKKMQHHNLNIIFEKLWYEDVIYKYGHNWIFNCFYNKFDWLSLKIASIEELIFNERFIKHLEKQFYKITKKILLWEYPNFYEDLVKKKVDYLYNILNQEWLL